jgi:hypothetical protein
MLDNKAYTDLLNDMNSYFILKNDKTINKNKFMNVLFKNYYDEYENKRLKIKEKILTYFDKNGISNSPIMADELSFKLLNNYESKELYFDKGITFNLIDEEEFIFKSLDNLKYETASLYFRNLIYSYLSLKSYERENIIYKDVLNVFNKAILNNKILKIKIENEELDILPYKALNNLDDKYTYLLALKANRTPFSINISKIINIIEKKDYYKFTKEEIEQLETIINKNIEYPNLTDENTKIRLTNLGIELYEKNYYNRPNYIKRSGNTFYFNNSTNQLYDYFISFGKKCKIIENNKLKKMFISDAKNNLKY